MRIFPLEILALIIGAYCSPLGVGHLLPDARSSLLSFLLGGVDEVGTPPEQAIPALVGDFLFLFSFQVSPNVCGEENDEPERNRPAKGKPHRRCRRPPRNEAKDF